MSEAYIGCLRHGQTTEGFICVFFFLSPLQRGLGGVLQTFGGIITFHRFGLDDDGGVTSLPCLAPCRHRPRHVAGREPQSCSQCRECGDKHGDDYFENLFLCHSSGLVGCTRGRQRVRKLRNNRTVTLFRKSCSFLSSAD